MVMLLKFKFQKLNLQLYKDIIYSDFCLLKLKIKKYYNVITFKKIKKFFCIINIFKIISNLKSLIFLLTKYDKKTKRYIVLKTLNDFFFDFFFKYQKKSKKIKLLNKYKNFYFWSKAHMRFDFKLSTYNIYISLSSNNMNIIKQLFRKNIFIFYSLEKHFLTYNLLNEIDDFKKLIFILIFLKKLLLKKSNY